jgi:hypothetical protein
VNPANQRSSTTRACRSSSCASRTSASSSASTASSRIGAATASPAEPSSVIATAPPPRLAASRSRAASTSTCRIARAATFRKCRRPAQSVADAGASFSHASRTSAMAFSVSDAWPRRTRIARRRSAS